MPNDWIMSANAARYAPRHDMAPHSHGESTICFVVSGGYDECIRGRRTRHAPGDILYYPADELHSQRFRAGGAAKVVIRLGPQAVDYLSTFLPLPDAPFARSTELLPIGRKLWVELEAGDAFSPRIVEGMIFEALGLFCRQGKARSAKGLVEAVKEMIDAEPRSGLGVRDIAVRFGEDPIRLALSFRRACGMSIGQYARASRLDAAARRLAQSSEPIAAIAAGLGFFDQAHLTRTFSRRFGISPGRYRRSGR